MHGTSTSYSQSNPHSDRALPLLDQKNRNLVNQRNFRSRRKQYVTELEEKLRAYQRAEIAATKQVQAVARAVAAENAVLRRFVREGLGWSEERLGWEVLNAMGVQQQPPTACAVSQTRFVGQDTPSPHREYSVGRGPGGLENTPERQHHVRALVAQHSPFVSEVYPSPSVSITDTSPTAQHVHAESTHESLQPTTLTTDQPSTIDHRHDEIHNEPNHNHNDHEDNNHDTHDDDDENFRSGSPSHTHELRQSQHDQDQNSIPDSNHDHEQASRTSNCMSCEQAATILSELRAQPSMMMNIDQIRAELGCSLSSLLTTCKVTHEKVFQRLDDAV